MCKVYLIDMDSVNDEIIWEITTLRASRNVSCKKKKKTLSWFVLVPCEELNHNGMLAFISSNSSCAIFALETLRL